MDNRLIAFEYSKLTNLNHFHVLCERKSKKKKLVSIVYECLLTEQEVEEVKAMETRVSCSEK